MLKGWAFIFACIGQNSWFLLIEHCNSDQSPELAATQATQAVARLKLILAPESNFVQILWAVQLLCDSGAKWDSERQRRNKQKIELKSSFGQLNSLVLQSFAWFDYSV